MNTGFGGIHGAILGLAARCLGNGQWSQSVRPQTDSEIALASVFAPGHQSETKFDVRVRRQELLLRKAVIEYLGTASDFTEPEITLVLSPVLSVPRHDERPTRVIGELFLLGIKGLSFDHGSLSYDSDGRRRDRGSEQPVRRPRCNVEANCGSLGGAVLARSHSGG